MILQLLKSKQRHVLVDIDTQRDFLLANGNACISDHADVLANIRRMMAWARHRSVPIISTAEVHPDNNGSSLVKYCIDGTTGQRKIRYTLLSNRVSFPADTMNPLPADLMRAYRQVILHKRSFNPFAEPRSDRLLTELPADEFIIVGAPTEGAVKATALGLLARGKHVTLIADATGSLSLPLARRALRQMKAKGAQLVDTNTLVSARKTA